MQIVYDVETATFGHLKLGILFKFPHLNAPYMKIETGAANLGLNLITNKTEPIDNNSEVVILEGHILIK